MDQEGEFERKTVASVAKEPIALPAGYEWTTLDLNDEEQIKEVYQLLKENYVEDSEHTFRFEYPIEFIRWALLVPGYIPDWHLGVRATKTKKLLAFISGTPVKAKIKERNVKLAQINYLCVAKKLREKRLAPVLIKEITRRVNLKEVWQAIYTAGVVIPRPISTATYLHRSLNAKKLIEVGFSALPMGETMASHLKRLKLPSEDEVAMTSGYMRVMQKKDIVSVYKLVKTHLAKFKLFPQYS